MNAPFKNIMLLATFAIAVTTTAMAQSDVPLWMTNTPRSTNNTNEIKVFIVYGGVHNSTEHGLVREVSRYLGEEWNLSGTGYDEGTVYIDGDDAYEEYRFGEEVHFSMCNEDVSFRLIDSYYIGNTQYYLCAVPTSRYTTPRYDMYSITSNYGARSLWRSAIVPGWGQFYKKQNLKGGLILGGSVLFAGGIIYTECGRKDYQHMMSQTHNVDQIRFYQRRHNNLTTTRNICIGALGALYVYNIVDAIVSPGPRYVKVKSNIQRGFYYAVAPTVSMDGAPMIAASITF